MDQPPSPLPADRVVAPRRRRWLGSLVAIICVALLGGLAWYLTHRPAAAPAGGGFGGPGGPSRAGGPGGARAGRGVAPVTVGIATASRADIPVLLDALGTVTPLENVTVQAQVAGVLTQVLFKEGQTVKKGDVLATIDPRPFQIALSQATGARLRDEASLQAARVTLARYQTLLTQDSIARQDVDTQASLVQQLVGTVAIDRAAENTAKLNLDWTRIVAPISGRVGLRPVDAGNYITTSSATGVATLTRITPIDVAFSIPQDRIPELQARLAAGAKLPVAAYDRTRTTQLDDGVFLTLDNAVDTTTGTVKAKARYANAAGHLFPNQFVNAELLLRTIDGAVVIPVTALRHGPNGDFVYVVKDGSTVELRNVTRGDAGVDNVAIASGLQVGEVVVTEGGDRLKDGARVQTSRRTGPSPVRLRCGASGARGGRGERRAASVRLRRERPDAGGASGAMRGASVTRRRAARSSPTSVERRRQCRPRSPLPTPEQRQRMLDCRQGRPRASSPAASSSCKTLDRGDPSALQRWQQQVSTGVAKAATQCTGRDEGRGEGCADFFADRHPRPRP